MTINLLFFFLKTTINLLKFIYLGESRAASRRSEIIIIKEMQTGFLTATPAGAVLLHSGIRRRCHIGSSNFPLPLTIPKLQLQPLRTSRGSVWSAAAFDVMRDYGSAIQDAGAMALTIAGAYALVSTFDGLTQRNLIPQVLSISISSP